MEKGGKREDARKNKKSRESHCCCSERRGEKGLSPLLTAEATLKKKGFWHKQRRKKTNNSLLTHLPLTKTEETGGGGRKNIFFSSFPPRYISRMYGTVWSRAKVGAWGSVEYLFRETKPCKSRTGIIFFRKAADRNRPNAGEEEENYTYGRMIRISNAHCFPQMSKVRYGSNFLGRYESNAQVFLLFQTKVFSPPHTNFG